MTETSARPYGAPLHCPKCEFKNYYGVLKLQGGPKLIRCPNCNTLLVNVVRRRPRQEVRAPMVASQKKAQ